MSEQKENTGNRLLYLSKLIQVMKRPTNRRSFLKTTALAGAAGLTQPLHWTASENELFANKSTTMKVKFYCPRWGAPDSWDAFCARVKQAGYDGVETNVPFEEKEKQEVLGALKTHGLELIGQYYQSNERDFDAHSKSYEKYLRHLVACGATFINCQTGKDYFPFEWNKKLIEQAARVSAETGVKIIHETHRGKALFAAHVARPFIEQIPGLRLTLDISHWCNVHESLLSDQQETVDLALGRTDHIHSRVGYPEGPQVSDPRAPEWSDALNAHLGWWDKVVALRQKDGAGQLTILTEFGPPDYLHTLPYTRQPVASQWDINVHMMNFLKKRYNP